MYRPSATEKQLNILIEFRQAVYECAFTRRRDALFELLDALLLRGPTVSFPYLSLASTCQRKWHSLYQAVEEGRIDGHWLSEYLAQQAPAQGICHWALDCTGWARVHAKKSPDRQYIYKPTPLASRGTVTIGYSYSLLDWVPANITQAEDRCRRIGKPDSVLVHHVVVDESLDCRMAKKLVRKQGVADAAIDDRPAGTPLPALQILFDREKESCADADGVAD